MGCGASSKKGDIDRDGEGPEGVPAKQEQELLQKPLFVLIENAIGLRDADWIPGAGKSDPYIVVRIGTRGSSWAAKFDDTGEQQWTSDVSANVSDPLWNLAFSVETVVFEAALRSLSSDDDWELQARIFDDDVLGDTFLGEVFTPIPSGPEATTVVLPVSGVSDPKGNVTMQFAFSDTPSWVKAELKHKASVINGTVSGGGMNMMITKMVDSVSVDWSKFMSHLTAAFGSKEDSVIVPHNLGYVADMVKFGLLAPTYSQVFLSRSADGGETAKDFPGPGCITVLSHARVVDGLKSVCAELGAGKITRTGPDGFLGLLRLNGAWWAQGDTAIEPPCITLATSIQKHTWLRPILDKYMGIGDAEATQDFIYQSARDWIDTKHTSVQPFRVRQDVKQWTIKVLHSLLLDVTLSDAELTEFVALQTKITLLSSFVPNGATRVVGPLLGLDEALNFRKRYMDRYSVVLKGKHTDLNADDLRYLSAAMLDTMLFAGGTSVALSISCALATVYGGNASPLARNAVPAPGAKEGKFAKQVAWESIRYFPPVVGFPWCTPGGGGASNAMATNRTCLALAAALKDPRVWGEDAEEFKLRPLAEYHKLSVAFAEQAVAQGMGGMGGGSRSCPGRSLALACITEFLKAWFSTEQKWNLPAEEQDKMVFTGSPTQKPDGFAFHPVAA